MKNKTLKEEISRIKGMMGKIMTESFEDNSMGLPEEPQEFKVGDTVSDPKNLHPDPDSDGKILAIFPNLESAKGSPNYELTVKYLKPEREDPNDTWYLIQWRKEGTYLYSKDDMKDVIIAPDGRDYDDYEEDEDYDDDTCSNCGGSGGGDGYYRCPICGGSGSSGSRTSRYFYRGDY